MSIKQEVDNLIDAADELSTAWVKVNERFWEEFWTLADGEFDITCDIGCYRNTRLFKTELEAQQKCISCNTPYIVNHGKFQAACEDALIEAFQSMMDIHGDEKLELFFVSYDTMPIISNAASECFVRMPDGTPTNHFRGIPIRSDETLKLGQFYACVSR